MSGYSLYYKQDRKLEKDKKEMKTNRFLDMAEKTVANFFAASHATVAAVNKSKSQLCGDIPYYDRPLEQLISVSV